ncbi:hypothetical protein [Arenimonas composti]|uniref:Uncharacterized protein n=1 Tax=Arenimonas composti TR7-09 = DSM 18010 TaxID=1121013 RepID=A0A091BJ29_9GAMM|nr:hypothetical protein [Arenimonas composti]KFN51517.1 hypothetical protein P873_00220 [Arenimonas composti TR7-09 = DSM 18010]
MRANEHDDSEGRFTAEQVAIGDGAAAAAMIGAGEPDFVPGPLPPPARRYLRPSAYWADRWLELRRP